MAQADTQTRRMWGWGDLPKGPRNHQRLLRARPAMGSQGRPVSMATHSLQACAHQHPQTQCSEKSSDQWVSLQPGLLEVSPVGLLNPWAVVQFLNTRSLANCPRRTLRDNTKYKTDFKIKSIYYIQKKLSESESFLWNEHNTAQCVPHHWRGSRLSLADVSEGRGKTRPWKMHVPSFEEVEHGYRPCS